ncbi:MAG: hypothetical protein K9W44_11145 [Candidatus Lokiarchaeota archaeon]|nr:hypothetical protein [Candidatus Harpocratesius repetitus]
MNFMKERRENSMIFEALLNAGLSTQEIEIYQQIKDKGAVSKGEIAIITSLPTEIIQTSINSLVSKNLLKIIPGQIEHFQALPPYVALTAQLSQFTAMINDLRKRTPVELKRSILKSNSNNEKGLHNLLEFVQEMHEMKQRLSLELVDQQRSLNKILQRLKNQKQTVLKLKMLRDRSIAILDNYFDSIMVEFGNLKEKIHINLEKLQLGIIVNTVEQMIERSIDAHLKSVKSEMKLNFERKLTRVLEETIDEIMQIPDNADEIEIQIRDAFNSVIKKFGITLESTQSTLNSISGNVSDSFGNLKETYSKKLTRTLDDILGKIQQRIDLELSILNRFWQEAMAKSNYSMQDVWFIRSPEGMQAQILEMLQRTKMKALIVLPRLNDLDVDLLMNLPNHLNIRICASINQKDPTHQMIMHKLDSKVNISYRDREVENLWGIHRDYEEIILGIVNNPNSGKGNGPIHNNIETSALEVAAVGSVLEEHIKIFVPILEDAWISAHKELSEGFKVKTPSTVRKIEYRNNQSAINQNIKANCITSSKFNGIKAKSVSKIKKSTTPTLTPTPLKGISVKFDTSPVSKLQDLASLELNKENKNKDSKNKTKEMKTNHIELNKITPKRVSLPKKVTVPKKEINLKKISKSSLVKPSERISQLNKQIDSVNVGKIGKIGKIGKTKKTEKTEKNKIPKGESEIISNAIFVRAESSPEYKKIIEKIDFIKNILPKTDAKDLVNELELLIKLYEGKTKFTRLVSEITNWSKDLQHQTQIDAFRRKIIFKRLENWRELTLN